MNTQNWVHCLVHLVAFCVIAGPAFSQSSPNAQDSTTAPAFDIRAAIEKTVAARKKIHSGEVVIHFLDTKSSNKLDEELRERTFHIWFHGDFCRLSTNWVNDGKSVYYCKIFGPKHAIDAVTGAPMEVTDVAHVKRSDWDVGNPLRLGLVPSKYGDAAFGTLDEIVQDKENPNPEETKVDDSELLGIPTFQAVFERNGFKHVFHFGKGDLNSALVGFDATPLPGDSNRWSALWRAKYKLTDGVLFPTEIDWKWFIDGIVTRQEKTTIQSAVFNQEIPDDVFSFDAIAKDFDGCEVIKNGTEHFSSVEAFLMSNSK